MLDILFWVLLAVWAVWVVAATCLHLGVIGQVKVVANHVASELRYLAWLGVAVPQLNRLRDNWPISLLDVLTGLLMLLIWLLLVGGRGAGDDRWYRRLVARPRPDPDAPTTRQRRRVKKGD